MSEDRAASSRAVLALSLGALVLALVGAGLLWWWPANVSPWVPSGTEAQATESSHVTRRDESLRLPSRPSDAGVAQVGSSGAQASSPLPTPSARTLPAPAAQQEAGGTAAGAPLRADEALPARGSDAGRRFHAEPEGIAQAIESALPDIKDCYDKWLELQPELAGQLRVSFTIASDDAGAAHVTGISVGDAGMGHPAFEGCVLSSFLDLEFDQPSGGGVWNVVYPIAFSRDDGGTATP
jgi:hypothetical protein